MKDSVIVAQITEPERGTPHEAGDGLTFPMAALLPSRAMTDPGGAPMSVIASALAGAAAWTGAEYLLHRFAMHERRGKGLASREHLQHHADVTYFSPTSKKILSAASTTAVVLPVTWAALGRRRALAFSGGMMVMYSTYEFAHRRVHTHPPRTRFGRWMRKSHLHHHFGAPMQNFGVTSPVWDKAFGTYSEPGTVTVPRRMAPEWLLDADGEVRPEYAGDYLAKGRRRRTDEDIERDHHDAFDNAAPLLA